jgi:hypothetical protein
MPKVSAVASASAVEVSRMRREVRRIVCSAPWLDACWGAMVDGRVRAKQRIATALDAARIYPPGGIKKAYRRHSTLMRRCSECGWIWYPPQYVRECSETC